MDKIIVFIANMIEEGKSLLKLKKDVEMWANIYPDKPQEFIQRLTRWINNIRQVLIYGQLTEFLKQTESIKIHEFNASSPEIALITGVLESAHDCLNAGFVGKLKYLMHAEMFDSLLDQSDELLEKGHLIPSAVLGRIVIENWLRDQAEKAGISNWETEKASALNESLKKMKIFSIPKWRQIQSYLDIGNCAAHGKDKDFSKEDVKLVIGFAKANCL